MNLQELLKEPGRHDHFVQLYQESGVLADSVAQYISTGLRRGEAAVIIATAEHRARFMAKLQDAENFVAQNQLKLLDAEETLAKFMANAMPQWRPFHELIGGLIAELRLHYPTVRAYGEMVDVLWQKGSREAALRLEEYWNELARLQTFSLFCAYRMNPLATEAYGGPLEGVCNAHTHLLSAGDTASFDAAVRAASTKVLDQPLADIVLSLAANHHVATRMPFGQATLFWLRQNMPRTAEKILSELRDSPSPAA